MAIANAIEIKQVKKSTSPKMKPVFQIVSQVPKFPISQIEHNGLHLRFKKPYVMTIRIDDKIFWHENDELGIYVFGETFDELADSFFDSFHFAWTAYAMEDDKLLDKGAQSLKRTLLKMCEVI